MEYIQDLVSLVGDVNIDKEELIELNAFTDEKVGFKHGTGKDYSQSKLLRSAFRKLKECNKMEQYLNLVRKHLADSIDDFYKKMDEES